MTRQRIIFRADGNAKIGLGHVSRCLALAELLAEDYDTCFAIQAPGDHVADSISKIVRETIALPFSSAGSSEFTRELESYLTGNEIVVIDGYQFDTQYEENLKIKARIVVSIDDLANRHFVSDAVFNFCGSFSVQHYSRENYTQLFTGLQYLFLRSPFLLTSPNKLFNSRLLLNMGGGDFDNQTLKILTELDSIDYPGEIEVIVGGSYPHLNSLDSIIKKRKSITLHQALTADEMFTCMKRCTLAIIPPSTVALEFLSTGGLTFLYQTADNQAFQKAYLIGSNLAYDYAAFTLMDLQEKELLFNKSLQLQKEIFNGSSRTRVKKIFKELQVSGKVAIRKATADDREQCFRWANDPEVRKHSYSTGAIAWEDHIRWFDRKLTDPACFYFIAEIDGQRIGQIRFDFLNTEEAYQISYTLDQHWRGKGLGYHLLVKGMQALGRATSFKRIIGYVQSTNVASVKAFQKAGFTSRISDIYPDSLKFELL